MFNNPSNNLYTQGIKDKKIQEEINAIFENMSDEEFEQALREAGFELEEEVSNERD